MAEWWRSYKKDRIPRKKDGRWIKPGKPDKKQKKDPTEGQARCQALQEEAEQDIRNLNRILRQH